MKKEWNELLELSDKQNFNFCQDFILNNLLEEIIFPPVLDIYNLNPGNVYHIHNVLSLSEINIVRSKIKSLQYYPVGQDGNASQYKNGDIVSSFRASFYDDVFAQMIYKRIEKLIPNIFKYDERDYSINHMNKTYNIVGLNPYNRLIKYEKNGKLNQHYDGHFQFNDKYQTLMTGLIYLTNNETGQTVFIEDIQSNMPINKRIESINIKNPRILLSIKPKEGDLLLFNQHLLHTTSPLINEEKEIILTDLIGRVI